MIVLLEQAWGDSNLANYHRPSKQLNSMQVDVES